MTGWCVCVCKVGTPGGPLCLHHVYLESMTPYIIVIIVYEYYVLLLKQLNYTHNNYINIK